MVKPPIKILIIRTDRLGDVILSTPVIKNLKLAFPQAHISFMCRPYTKEALLGNPWLDEVIVYDKYGKHKSFFATIKFSFFLRKKQFDWAVILHPTNRVHLLAFLAGIPLRAGWDRKLGFLLNKKLFHTKDKGEKHELDYTLDVLRSLDVPIQEKNTYFPFDKKANKRVEELLKNKGLAEDDKFIAIHPSASCISKRWPIDHFMELIRLLKEKTNFKIIVISSEAEKSFVKRLTEELDVIDLCGSLGISELGSLLKRATLFISNDSGPVHIAASLNTPVISIFGRKDPGLSPTRWKPVGKQAYYIHKDAGCRICLAHNCQRGFQCLGNISPQDLLEIVMNIFKGNNDSR